MGKNKRLSKVINIITHYDKRELVKAIIVISSVNCPEAENSIVFIFHTLKIVLLL